jgi:signal transduction histidine kinase/CheY-like chemotaxis protein
VNAALSSHAVGDPGGADRAEAGATSVVPAACTAEDDLARELDERRLRFIAEQAAGLRWQIVLTASIVVAIVWGHAPAWLALAWFALVAGVREWRAAALGRLVQARQRPIAERLAATTRWNLLLGACNGSAALFMPWLPDTLAAVLTMLLVSWGAGAVSTSSTHLRAFVAYAAMLFVPTAAMWLVPGTWLGLGIAALVVMFFGVQARFARQNCATFEQSFRIREENRALAERLAREQQATAEARDKAVRANLEKSRFLAAASHDLRQPLQALTLNGGELAARLAGGAEQPIVADLQASIEQLRAMLDALLDLSKLDAGAVVPAPRRVRLDLLLQGVVAALRASAQAKGLRLEVNCPAGLALHTDPDLLRRMLANVLDNAIKFSPAGEVSVEVTSLPGPRGGQARIAVRDSGPGIAPEHHAQIFEDLVQLPGSARAKGHGLGLGIVRRMASLLGTQVQVESAVGRGATFAWTLPLHEADERDAPAAGGPIELRGLKVLVLDDDSMLRGAYANVLAGLGAQARHAADIDEALRSQAEEAPDAALVDYRLERGETGAAAVQRLRERQPALPVVMVSADTDAQVVDAARALGVPLLRKPADAAALGRALTQVCERRRGRP